MNSPIYLKPVKTSTTSKLYSLASFLTKSLVTIVFTTIGWLKTSPFSFNLLNLTALIDENSLFYEFISPKEDDIPSLRLGYKNKKTSP